MTSQNKGVRNPLPITIITYLYIYILCYFYIIHCKSFFILYMYMDFKYYLVNLYTYEVQLVGIGW